MGAWGTAAWECDSAADWFGDTFDATGLAWHVETALNLDLEDHHEEIRAAAYLVAVLGRVYIWPIDDLARHVELAISRLEAIIDAGIYDDAPEFVAAIRNEISLLSSRRLDPPET